MQIVMRKKRKLCLFAAVILLLTVCGCGGYNILNPASSNLNETKQTILAEQNTFGISDAVKTRYDTPAPILTDMLPPNTAEVSITEPSDGDLVRGWILSHLYSSI